MERTLTRTRRNWERFAQTDPMAAIMLRAPGTPAWVVQDFFDSGETYIHGLVTHVLEPRGLPVTRGRVLDFGCGMGRLSQALAARFAEVVGVDISREMLALAHKHNTRKNLSFLHNMADDLAVLPDDSFDLVLSVIVLQHIPPQATRSYIREFIRLIRPGGLVVFQLPVRDLIVDRGFLWEATNEVRRLIYRPRRIVEVGRRMRQLLGIDPKMEMRGIPRADVEAHLRASGGRLIEAVEDFSAGDAVQSFLYLVTK